MSKSVLALGIVINALADEERLAKGESAHVTYRQTQLPKPARDLLDENSQIIFWHVPSDGDGSEIVST